METEAKITRKKQGLFLEGGASQHVMTERSSEWKWAFKGGDRRFK